MPDVVFERSRPAAAAALFERLPTTEPRGRERRVSIEVQPTQERRGLFRRPVPVSSVSISVVFPEPDHNPSLLVQVGNLGWQMSGTFDPFGYGDALARDLSAKGVKTPDGWSLFWSFNSEVHWVVPYDEDPVRVIDHALTVLEAICETPPQTFEAKVERGSRYDGQFGIPSNMQ
jgi:hypothetical protein